MSSGTSVTRSTLDIQFHIQDGTVMGDSYTWKLNNPVANLSLQQVKDAFGFDSSYNYMGYLINQLGIKPITKEGYFIDGVDSARVVTTVTTKTELS